MAEPLKKKKFWEFRITSPFGANDTDVRSGPHKGIDFGVPLNTDVTPRMQSESGYVAKAVTGDPELGNYVVVVDADGSFATYGHLASIAVKKGASVTEDTILGKSGATGKVTGPHVHFSVSDADGTVVDPTPLFAGTSTGKRTVFGDTTDPNAPPANNDEGETKDWFAQLAASLGYLTKAQPGTPLMPEIGPGTVSQGLFNRAPSTGSGRDIFDNAPSFQGGVGTQEGAQLLPALDRSLGGKSAFAENIIRGLGMIPGRGNPFVDQMQRESERLATPAFFARLMRGESIDQRAIADDVVNLIRSGKQRPMEMDEMRNAFASLPSDNTAMTPQQEMLASILRERPNMIAELITDTTNLPPDLAGLMPGILQRRQRAALRSSADVPQASLADFLMRP